MIQLRLSGPVSPELPVEVSVPFPEGVFTDGQSALVKDADGTPCETQWRPLLKWPDGSVKWAMVLFDPGKRPAAGQSAEYALEFTDNAQEQQLLAWKEDDRICVDTGVVQFSIPTTNAADVHERTQGVLTDLRRGESALTRPRLDGGLVAREADGELYSSQKSGPQFMPINGPDMPHSGASIIEAGPLRCRVRLASKMCRDNYRASLDAIFVIEAYRGSGLVRLRTTWRHGKDGNERWAGQADREARFIKDMRLRLPLAFRPTSLRAGIDRGVAEEDLLETSRYSLLQMDVDAYRLLRSDWDGDVVPIKHGSADGKRAPGWLQAVADDGRQLSVYAPYFSEEYPNELTVSADSLEFGLWPEGANETLSKKDILPPHWSDDPARRHVHDEYSALITHPYIAFFNKEHCCLETVRGMQKSQDVFLDATPGVSAEEWQRRIAEGLLKVPRAAVDPYAVDEAKVLGPMGPAADSSAEPAIQNAAEWVGRHHEFFDIRYKFDHGDLLYIIESPYHEEYRHVSLKVHPRVGYWNNNEEDPIHGLFLHGLRTGDPSWFSLVEMMGRHLWDVDMRHYPMWGMHTHSHGHCFRSLTSQATDHFWITSLIDYYLLTGDPDVLEGIRGLARYAADHLREIRYANSNLREVSIAIMQCVDNYNVLYEESLLDSAENMAAQIVEEQKPDGYFPTLGHEKAKTSDRPDGSNPSALFGTLALEALWGLNELRPNPEMRESAYRQIDWFIEKGLLPAGDAINARCQPDGGRPPAMRGFPEGWAEYSLGDFQLIKGLAFGMRWAARDGMPERVKRYGASGDRIVARLLREQMGPEYGPEFEGNWPTSRLVADPEPGDTHTRPRHPVDPSRCPYQIRPLGVSAAMRCLPYYIAARAEAEAQLSGA
jgi:hypothetical protein